MNKDEAQRTMMGSYLTGLRKATFGLFVMGGLWAAGGYGIAGITAPLISNIYAIFGYGDGDEDLWFTDEQLKAYFICCFKFLGRNFHWTVCQRHITREQI